MHLIRNHPLPDGNKRVAYLCLREFLARNGYEWHVPPAQIADEIVAIIEGVAAGKVSPAALQAWLESHVRNATPPAAP